MSRTYKIKAKMHWVYSAAEILELYDICRNTLSNWVSEGLCPSPGTGPQLFRGAELNRFHEERRARNRHNLRIGQFLCTGCKCGVFPDIQTLKIRDLGNGKIVAQANCPDRGCNVIKFLGATESDAMQNCLNTNTALHQIDETKGPKPACVGTKPKTGVQVELTLNDGILHNWQLYAGKYDVKTADAHLASIRDFEAFVDAKCLSIVTASDAARYRNWLITKGELPKEEGGLSSSTIRHRASNLKEFFNWLAKQEGYRRLSANILDQFDLPKRQLAKILPRQDKDYPTLEEAKAMVASMPSSTPLMRRDRAIVALAFLSALRAGALSSLRLKHLDLVARTVTQDGSEMRAKNGKSFVVQWFPGAEYFETFVIEWKAELQALGLGAQDALFPHASYLKKRKPEGDVVRPLNTNGSVNRAFAIASKGINKSYSPHSARHYIAAQRDKFCSSREELKAWSLNMGHEKEAITETHYAKMTSSARMEILSNIGQNPSAGSHTESDKDLILGYVFNEFPKGSPDYVRAKALYRKMEDDREAERLVE